MFPLVSLWSYVSSRQLSLAGEVPGQVCPLSPVSGCPAPPDDHFAAVCLHFASNMRTLSNAGNREVR